MYCDQAVLNASLSQLTNESRNLLSTFLNTKKVLPHIGPDGITRQRDWRGLASLANISNELKLSIDTQCSDKVAKVLELWTDMDDNTATVLNLLKHLEMIDRFDVRDDLLLLDSEGRLIEDNDNDIITFEDKEFGTPQFYHAYVLYAQEDRDFFDELCKMMTSKGFRLCSEDNLLPGHATRYQPLSRLMLVRCRHIILIYSPEFLRTPAITFFMNLAQADGITRKKLKIIPVMYRECLLPEHLRFYHNLRYSRLDEKAPFNFWKKLSNTLGSVELTGNRLNSTSSSHSDLVISELANGLNPGYTSTGYTSAGYTPAGYTPAGYTTPVKKYSNDGLNSSNSLPLPSLSQESVSLGDLRDIDLSSDSRSISQTSEGSKKKLKSLKNFFAKPFRKQKQHNQRETVILK